MQTTLTAQAPSQNGASIFHNNDSVTVSDSNFKVNVASPPIGYDLKLSLDNSWGFKAFQNSTITLTLYGHTPNATEDTDMLIVFSVNDWQYFSFFIHLDNTNNIKSRIYPSVALQNITESVSNWMSGPNAILSRWNRISNNDKWLMPFRWNKQSHFPLTFMITNDPINNKSYFSFYHNITNTYVLSYTFNQQFIPNENMDVYILGDNLYETFVIQSINIQLNSTVPSSAMPTVTPSNIPSHIPSHIPSNVPSYFPSIMPSKYPSMGPLQMTTELPMATEANETSLTGLYSTRNIISSLNLWETDSTTQLTDASKSDVYSTVYTNNTTIEFVENESSSLGQIYLIIFSILLCAVIYLTVCILVYFGKQSPNKPMKIRRQSQEILQMQRKIKSKSSSESRHTPPSNVVNVDGINLVNIFEEVEEDVNNSDSEIIIRKKTTEDFEYGEEVNININDDEFIIESDSDNCMQNNQCNNGQFIDNDEIIGEYDMEGNQNDENDEIDVNMNRQHTVTNDMIGDDEFIVKSENENDYTLGD